MLISLVNSLSINLAVRTWQEVNENGPIKYKTVRQLLISDLATRRD